MALAIEIFESASELAQIHRATGPLAKPLLLLGPRTATLNQNNQDYDNQYSGSYPNDHDTFHAIPLSQSNLRVAPPGLSQTTGAPGVQVEKIADPKQLLTGRRNETLRRR